MPTPCSHELIHAATHACVCAVCGFSHRSPRVVFVYRLPKVLLAERNSTQRELTAIKCIKKADILAREELDSMVTELNVPSGGKTALPAALRPQ